MLPSLLLNYHPGNNVVNFTINNLPEKETIRIKFDNLNLIDDYSIEADNGIILGSRILLDSSPPSLSGTIVPKNNNINTDYLSVSLLIEVKLDTGFDILSVSAAGCDIYEEDRSYDVGTIPELRVDKEFINIDEVSKIDIVATPNIFLDFRVNDKIFKIKTNSSGNGSLSLNPVQFCNSHQINSNQVLRFPIQYKIESNKEFMSTGKKIHFVPEKIKALQATNSPDAPDCVILDPNAEPQFIFRFEDFDKPGYSGPIVGPFYDSSGANLGDSTILSNYEHSKKGNISVISSSLLGDFQSCFINSNFSVSKAKSHLNNSDSTFTRFAFSAIDREEEPDSTCEVAPFSSSFSRVVVGSTPEGQGVNSFGINRGMIIKPDPYYHSLLIDDSALSGDVFAVLFRFSDGSLIEKNHIFNSDDSLLEAYQFVSDLKLDTDIISRDINVNIIDDKIDISSSVAFTITISDVPDNIVNGIKSVILNSNAALELFVTEVKDEQSIIDAQYVLFFDDKFRGIRFDIISYESSVIRMSVCPGYNRPGGFYINDFIYCLDFIAATDVDGGQSWETTSIESLPFITKDTLPISSLNPQISSSGRVICEAAIDDRLQLFLYTPNSDVEWSQLTHVGENKNPRIVEDDMKNIHIVWESDRSGITQLYYSCLGPSSRMFTNLAIDNFLAKISESNSDEECVQLSLNSSLEIISEESLSVVEKNISSQQILLEGYLESDSDAHIIQEFIGPSPIHFDSVGLDSVSSTHLFNNNIGVLPAGVDGFDGFDKDSFISSLYVHIDPVGPVQSNDSSWQSTGNKKTISFYFKSDYKIVGMSYTENELNASDDFFAPRKYKYEAHRSVDNVSYEINFDSDMKGFVLSLTFDGEERLYKVAGMRVYLSIPYSDISSTYSGEWFRFVSQDGKCSVKEKDRVSVDFNPLRSSASAISVLNKNEYGDFFDGLYSQLNYQVGFDFDLALSNRKYKTIKEVGLNVDVFNEINRSIKFSVSPPMASDPSNIIVYNEFIGNIESHIGEKTLSDFTHNDSSILKIKDDDVYFSGVHFGDFISSCYIHVNPESGSKSFSSKVEFSSAILDVIWKSDDLKGIDDSVSNENLLYGSLDRGLDSTNGTYSIQLDKTRTVLSFDASFDSIPSNGVGFRVILSGSPVKDRFDKKTEEQIREKYRDFKSTFSNVSIDVFEKFNNRYNISHIQSKFDSLIPIFGSMRFDVLSSNPLSESSTGVESNQIIQLINNSIDSRTVPSINTIPGTEQYYDISANFKINRTQTPLYHYLICLIPEVDYFTATNVETFSEYCSRTSQHPSSCNDYNGIMSNSTFTGKFRIGVLASTKESLETNEQARKRYKLVYTTSKVFDLTSDKNILISANYTKQSSQSLDRIVNYDNSISLSSDEQDRVREDFHWILSLQVLINGKSGISETFYVDMSDLRRQFDLSFGCPVFGKYISEEIIPFNGLEMSDIDLMLTYKNIRIGNGLIKFNNSIINVGKFHRNLDSKSYYGYLGESLTNNDSFESSSIDPYSESPFGLGDYQPLPDGSSSIDSWDVINGGAVYVGPYYRAYSGDRSVLLESVESVSEDEGDSSAPYDTWTYNWSRNGYIGMGYGGGISQTLDLISGDKYYVRVIISCRPYDPSSGASLSFNKTIDISVNGSSKEYLAPQFYGNFTGSVYDDYVYRTIILEFTSEGTDVINIINSTDIPEDSGDYDKYRGGIVVDQVNVFKSTNLSYENTPINEYDILGVSSQEYDNNYYINAVDEIPQIPVTFDGINKSHDLYLDNFGKMHLAWQSNRDDSWDIYYASGRVADLLFREEVKITSTNSTSSRPSVCADNNGKRMIAWHDDRDGNRQVYSAISNELDPDYVDPCVYDKYIYASNQLPSLDPYDPYSYFIDDLNCSLKFDFTPKEYGFYQFKLLLYDDEDKKMLVKTISSITNTSGWYVSDVPILSTGHSMQPGIKHTIEYVLSYEDDVENKLYYVDAYIETIESSSGDFGSVDEVLSENISYIDEFQSINLSGQGETHNNNFIARVVREFIGPSKISYPSRKESDFKDAVFSDTFQENKLSLPSGQESLIGFGASEDIASFIVHAQSDSSFDIFYNIRIDFANPILAVIPYSNELNDTDLSLGSNSITYSNANNRGSLDHVDDFISITNDMKTVIISCHSSQNDISEIRIVTGGKAKKEFFIGHTVFYCPYGQSSSCNVPITYTNTSDSVKNINFRVTAFNDSSLNSVVLSQYSGYDSTNFKYGINKIPYSGIEVDVGQTINLSYDPSFMDEKNIGWADRLTHNRIISSEFAGDIEGWSCVAINASGYPSSSSSPDVSHESKTNGDGFLRSIIYLIYENSNNVLYWSSPVKFHGQKSQFVDGKIIVRLSHSIDGGGYTSISPISDRDYMDDIILEDFDGTRISTSFPYTMSEPDGDFIRYEIDLSNKQLWRSAEDNSIDGSSVSYDVIRSVLFNLKHIYIRAEYFNRSDGTSNELYLDEVSLVSADDNRILSSNRYSNLLCGVPYYFKSEVIDADVYESLTGPLSAELPSVVIFAIDGNSNISSGIAEIKQFIEDSLEVLEGTNTMCGIFVVGNTISQPIVDLTFDYSLIVDGLTDLSFNSSITYYVNIFSQVSSMIEETSFVDVGNPNNFVVFLTGSPPAEGSSSVYDHFNQNDIIGRYVSVAVGDLSEDTYDVLSFISNYTGGESFTTPLEDLGVITGDVYGYLLNNTSTGSSSSLGQSVLKSDIKNVLCPCRQVGFENPRRLIDSISWQCGGSGLDDIRITNTDTPALNPVLSSTNFGFFYIAWEDYRHSVYEYAIDDESLGTIDTNALPQIFGCVFSIDESKSYSSVNNISDIQFASTDDGFSEISPYPAFAPQIVTDDFQNIMIFTRGSDSPHLIYSSIGTLNVPSDDTSLLSCNLLDSTNRPDTLSKPRTLGDHQYETIRLTGDSIAYTTYLNANTPLVVIDDCFINLDILGIPGTYAVRLKNENDIDWSEWMSISNDSGSSSDDLFNAMFSARFVDTDRFVVPWISSSGNGFKRVCCEVLTFFGKTNSFCIDFYAIYKLLNYSIDLFYDEEFTQPMSVYNNYPVIGPVKYNDQIKDDDLSSLSQDPLEIEEYYGKLVFQDVDRIKKLEVIFDNGFFADRFFQEDLITCTVFQQGLSVDSAVDIARIDSGVYRLKFDIIKSDGVLYKDGLGVIKIKVSGQCGSTDLDLSVKEEKRLINTDLLESTSIYNNQTLFIDKYSKDDLYNSFGNINYYNKSFYNDDGSIKNLDKVSSITSKNMLDPVDFGSLMQPFSFVRSSGDDGDDGSGSGGGGGLGGGPPPGGGSGGGVGGGGTG